jgi:peptide/nickel transport system substrate-binding protein
MNVWLSSGETHLWHPVQEKPATPWEAEIDRLMEQQMTTLDYAKRKHLYDQVQEIAAENLPIICLASPNILVGARDRIGNFRPAILDPYTLWNVEQLFIR